MEADAARQPIVARIGRSGDALTCLIIRAMIKAYLLSANAFIYVNLCIQLAIFPQFIQISAIKCNNQSPKAYVTDS